jgi:hypothetical protein
MLFYLKTSSWVSIVEMRKREVEEQAVIIVLASHDSGDYHRLAAAVNASQRIVDKAAASNATISTPGKFTNREVAESMNWRLDEVHRAL